MGFDGSSTVEETLQYLCKRLDLRPVRQSGYCLFAQSPRLSDSMQPSKLKDKVRWCRPEFLLSWKLQFSSGLWRSKSVGNWTERGDVWTSAHKPLSSFQSETKVCENAVSMDISADISYRFYWRHFADGATEKETVFQAFEMCGEVRQGKVPVSAELAIELAAFFFRMHFARGTKCDDAMVQYCIDAVVPENFVNVLCHAVLMYDFSPVVT